MADGRHLENRYDVITLLRMIRFRWNLVRPWKTTCRWPRSDQNGSRRYNINMATIRFRKTEYLRPRLLIRLRLALYKSFTYSLTYVRLFSKCASDNISAIDWDWETANIIKCKTCRFIKMCKVHHWVTYIKQQTLN